MKKIACVFLAIIFIFQLGIASFAIEDEAPQGGLTPEEARKTNSDILNEILNDPEISDEAKQQVSEKMSYAGKGARKGEPSGGWLLYIPIMQEDAYKCAPAVIQQSLKAIYDYEYVTDSQTKIQNEVGKGPGLNTVLNYLNNHQNANYFVRIHVESTQELDGRLLWAQDNWCPVIFTLAADKTFWPYPTSGHFTNLSGYYTDDNWDEYRFVDPFYYPKYVPSEPNASGILWISKEKGWKANTKLFGEGNNTVAY